jgi:hypothetical protein
MNMYAALLFSRMPIRYTSSGNVPQQVIASSRNLRVIKFLLDVHTLVSGRSVVAAILILSRMISSKGVRA